MCYEFFQALLIHLFSLLLPGGGARKRILQLFLRMVHGRLQLPQNAVQLLRSVVCVLSGLQLNQLRFQTLKPPVFIGETVLKQFLDGFESLRCVAKHRHQMFPCHDLTSECLCFMTRLSLLIVLLELCFQLGFNAGLFLKHRCAKLLGSIVI